MGEAAFVTSERRCVMITTAVMVNCRVSDVEHFVKENVLDDKQRNALRIEGTADRYGVMS